MITEYNNSKHNTPTKINSRKQLINYIGKIAWNCNKYWTLCNKIVGKTNEFTQIINGTHFKPHQFFGVDYDPANISHNKSLNLGANFFAGDFEVQYFNNTDPNDECVVNLDTTNFPERSVEYVVNFINLFFNNDYKPPVIFVNSIIKNRWRELPENHFVESIQSHPYYPEDWVFKNLFEYKNGKSTMQYNICIPLNS